MSIIRASKRFEGSELKPRSNTYIKSDVRSVSFGKEEKDGIFLFILGAYKEDSNGNGVWYRPLKIRDNFGTQMTKEKFAVQPNCPLEYFENKVRGFAPNMCKPTETQDENGRIRRTYPAWGRSTWRVLYNAAYFGKFEKGVHVLDLPQSGGASAIDEFVRGQQPDKTDNPDITNYEAAIPVHIKLDLGASGQPWKIRIDGSRVYTLPQELADTDYLYNLDDVINFVPAAALIQKLKEVVPMDIFRKGLDGYDNGGLLPEIATGPVTSVAPHHAIKPAPVTATEAEDDIPMGETPTPVVATQVIPKPVKSVAPAVVIPKPNKAPVAAPVPAETDQDDTVVPVNPVATTSVATAMAAARAALGRNAVPRS